MPMTPVADAVERVFARYDNHDAALARSIVLAALSDLEAMQPSASAQIAKARASVVDLLADGDPATVRGDIAGVFAGLADLIDDDRPEAPATDGED